jgi:RNA polymerase sigma-70 factor (ECF subfamily)
MTAKPRLNYSAMSDLDLASCCADGNRDAVRLVTVANNQRLFRAAWSVLRDRHDAEEAVQAGYLKAFAAMETFAGRSSLSTWLTRIVVNEALMRRRAALRRRAHLEVEGVMILDKYRAAAEPDAPDAALAREQLRLLLERAVAELPDAFRTVFVLRQVEGLSVDETADALGLAAATVKTRLMRARRRLQAALAPDVRGALDGSFPFAGADCAALTDRVLAALATQK